MDAQVSFPSLATALAGRALEGSASSSFRIYSSEKFFVNPQLLVQGGLGDLASPVILVSARGAAGKSRLAEELSRQLGAPLWKLEKDKAVSGTSLQFTLGRYLNVADGMAALEDGPSPVVLIDSLDEARARVSGTSWDEFLESISEAVTHGCRFVLFGRERILEEVWLNLSDSVPSVAWLEISHFGPAERLQYVDGVVRLRSKSEAVLMGAYYKAARDAVLKSVVSSVPNQAADEFSGYAPVLDAVAAVLLREENHFSLSNTFGKHGGEARHLQELRRILDDLLARDQGKMKPVASQLGLDPSLTYTPNEQIDWLCHDLEGGQAPGLPHITDPQVRKDYIDSVRPFLNDHPFRNETRWASAVFVAYIASRRFGTAIANERLIEVGNDSSLLFDFVALEGDESFIDEWQFAALHASIAAGEFSGALASVAALEVGESEYDASIGLIRSGVSSQTYFTLVSEDTRRLTLFGPLEGLTISTSGGVRIPSSGIPKMLGPDLFLHCRELTIEGAAVEFAHRPALAPDAEPSGNGVVIEVEGGIQLPHSIARDPSPGEFELRVPESTVLRYPWTNYREPLPPYKTADPADRAVRFLKMFMNLTRTHGHTGERGAFMMKLQGCQSLKGEDFKAAVGVLEQRGIARVEGVMIYVRAEYESYRFSGKTIPGQRLIDDVWDFWQPVSLEIAEKIR